MSLNAPGHSAIPWVGLDEVTEIHSFGISTKKTVSPNENFFDGHFPGYPILPGVFLIEAVHQAAQRYAESLSIAVTLREVVSARFLAQVRPGDLLEINCQCDRCTERSELLVTATCRCGPRKTASIKMAYYLGDN